MRQVYDDLCAWLTQHPITTGGVLALVLTALRLQLSSDRSRTSFSTIVLEGLSCGLLSMAFSYAAINICGLDSSVGVFCGATAGFIGLDRLEALFIRIVDAYIARRTRTAAGGVLPPYDEDRNQPGDGL